MSTPATLKINIRTGEIEISGSESFVEKRVGELEELVKLFGVKRFAKPEAAGAGEPEELEALDEVEGGDSATKKSTDMPSSFGEWMHGFRNNVADVDKALITAKWVQSLSPSKDFKTSEVNKSLKDHGIKLTNPSRSLKLLETKKHLFQTRKVGVLRYMRVSVDGQNHLESLKREAKSKTAENGG